MKKNQIPVFSRAELDNAFASYAGMEGGNPDAAVWVCDGSPPPGCVPLESAFEPQWSPGAWDMAFRHRHEREMSRWQTHYRIARVMAAAREAVLPPGRTSIDAQEYFDDYLYAPHGWEFKLNLFPLPDRPDPTLPWTKAFDRQPELRSKPAYLSLCRDGARFRFLRAARRQYRPRVLLCLGERLADDYLRAFGFEGVVPEEAILQPADTPRRLQVYWHEGTTLVLSPTFGGAQGLSSDVLLDALGAYLSQWLRATDFPFCRGVTDIAPLGALRSAMTTSDAIGRIRSQPCMAA